MLLDEAKHLSKIIKMDKNSFIFSSERMQWIVGWVEQEVVTGQGYLMCSFAEWHS
jgi:hypothetical protein